MATDLSVVNSARVSFGKRKEFIQDEDILLINYLIRSGHGTPFEHNAFRFHVRAPIFVFREWHRHRIASINEMSGRYTKLPDKWYIPKLSDVRVRVGKPGHYTYESATEEVATRYIANLTDQCKLSYRFYERALDEGVAPEQARFFLHVNHYSEMYWTINARSLMNFLSLRNEEHAQWEIRVFAQVLEYYFEEFMPHTCAAFNKNGRVAP